jgi:hypothetical protein
VQIFCDVCGKVCGKNYLRSGTLEVDFSTRIMPLLTALSLQEFQANNGMIVAPRPSYFLYLASCDILMFPKLQLALKERKFHDIMIQEQSQTVFYYFFRCFRQWHIHRAHTVKLQRGYCGKNRMK